MWRISGLFVAVLALLVVLAGCGQDAPVEQAEDEAGVEEVAPEPTPDDIAQAFQDEGLEVGEYYHVEEDPEWGTGMLPKTMDSGTRVELPSYSVGEDPAITDVFHFDTSEDQQVVSDYLDTVTQEGGGMFYTHVYETDGFLLKIDGNVPKLVADQYGSVLEMVAG